MPEPEPTPSVSPPPGRILILGGGPAGIGAAVRLTELGHENWRLIERFPRVGGLAASFTDPKGFTWDVGGHVLFSHYQYVDDVIAKFGPKMHERVRKAYVVLDSGKRFVDYPLQNNLDQLEAEESVKCINGILDILAQPKQVALIANSSEAISCGAAMQSLSSPQTPCLLQSPCLQRSFQDWCIQTLGVGLYDFFMEKYNLKVWAIHPSLMNSTWVSERVALPDLKPIIRNLITKGIQNDASKSPGSWGPNALFKYPVYGGTGAIWESVSKSALPAGKLSLGVFITSIDPRTREVRLSNGDIETYDAIVSTIPLDLLVRQQLVDSSIPSYAVAREAVNGLKFSSTHVIGIGIEGRPGNHIAGKTWFYFPDGDTDFYRMMLLSSCSENVCPCPESQYSLLFEISESQYKPYPYAKVDVIQRVLTQAKQVGMIEENAEIASTFYSKFERGYPTPCLTRDASLATLIPILESEARIFSRGRFGGWKYEVGNQDHSFMQGVEAVDHILASGVCDSQMEKCVLHFDEQQTFKQPHFVNESCNRSEIRLRTW